jgi:hypothetical protein
MASSIVLSDNGVSSGSAGIKSSGGNDGTLLLQTTTAAGAATTAVTVDNTQNVGVGVTPSAWGSSYKAVQMSYATMMNSSSGGYYGANFYYNSSNNPIYVNNGYALAYSAYSVAGAHLWLTAPSGTAGNAITFTQAMTLDASGNLLVGTTSYGVSAAGFGVGSSGRSICAMTASTSAATTLEVYSTGAGAFRFYVDMGGTVHATSIAITAISDQRLKENVRDLDTGLDSIMALQPRRFDWKEGKGQDKKNAAGFIAQEFEEVFPECVGVSKAGDDGIEYKNINHETLIPTLVKAIQEQQAIIQAQAADIAALKAKVGI